MRQIELAQQFTDTFGTHCGVKIVAVLFDLGEIIIFSQKLTLVQRCHARVCNHECFEIQHAFNIAKRHVEHHAQTARQ